jgi:hypothetical protein
LVNVQNASSGFLETHFQPLNRNEGGVPDNPIKTPTSLTCPFQEINAPNCCCQAVSWRTYRIKIDGDDAPPGNSKPRNSFNEYS